MAATKDRYIVTVYTTVPGLLFTGIYKTRKAALERFGLLRQDNFHNRPLGLMTPYGYVEIDSAIIASIGWSSVREQAVMQAEHASVHEDAVRQVKIAQQR